LTGRRQRRLLRKATQFAGIRPQTLLEIDLPTNSASCRRAAWGRRSRHPARKAHKPAGLTAVAKRGVLRCLSWGDSRPSRTATATCFSGFARHQINWEEGQARRFCRGVVARGFQVVWLWISATEPTAGVAKATSRTRDRVEIRRRAAWGRRSKRPGRNAGHKKGPGRGRNPGPQVWIRFGDVTESGGGSAQGGKRTLALRRAFVMTSGGFKKFRWIEKYFFVVFL